MTPYTPYSPKLAAKICAELATGKSLRTVCTPDDMPNRDTVFTWLGKFPEFADQYARAKREAADALIEQMTELDDQAINDARAQVVDPKASSALVTAYRNKTDNIKWYLSKIVPKKYGDSLKLEGGDNPIPLQILGGVTKQIAEPKVDEPSDKGA